VDVRQQLATALGAALGEKFAIVPDPRELAELQVPVVQLVRTVTKPAPEAPNGALQVDFDAWLIMPNQSAEAGEDDLDDALDELLVALRAIDWVLWESATRSTYGDPGFLAYKVPLSTVINITEKD